jgi:hypothetical protein
MSDITMESVAKKLASSGRVKYSDSVIIRENKKTRISLVINYIPRSDGTQELKCKLDTYSKSQKPQGVEFAWSWDGEKSTQWLFENEIRELIHALNTDETWKAEGRVEEPAVAVNASACHFTASSHL